MTYSFRVIDLRSAIIDAEVRIVETTSPEQAVLDALEVDAVRSGSKKDLIARVYWQKSPSEPTNMVRMYRRLDPDRAIRDSEKQSRRS